MIDVDKVLKRKKQALADRQNFESSYQTVRDLFAPYHEAIISKETDGNELDFSKIWTDEPIEAVRVFVAGLQSYLTPANVEWIKLRISRNQYTQELDAYLESVSEELNYTLANSNFYTAIAEVFLQSVLYGMTTMLIEKDDRDRVMFTTLPVGAVAVVENSKGEINEWFITQMFTVEQAIDKFGEENLSKEMLEKIKQCDDINTKYPFTYHIKERAYYNREKKDAKNMPISACWIDDTYKHVCYEGGYNELPIASHRFYKRSTSAYGYSPCILCIASCRTLNKVSSTNLRGGMKMADPAIAVPSKGFITRINTNPNGVNLYQKDVTKDSIFQIPGGTGVPFTIEFEQRLADRLKRMLFNDVFKALSGVTKEMTVPEVQQRILEALTQLGASIGRYQTELLDQTIERVLSIMAEIGVLPELPAGINSNINYEIEYTSYLFQMNKQGGVRSIYDGLGILGQLASIDPAVIDNFDVDEAWKVVSDVVNLPAKISRSELKVEQIRKARAEQVAAQQQMMAMEQGAKVVKDVGGTLQ